MSACRGIQSGNSEPRGGGTCSAAGNIGRRRDDGRLCDITRAGARVFAKSLPKQSPVNARPERWARNISPTLSCASCAKSSPKLARLLRLSTYIFHIISHQNFGSRREMGIPRWFWLNAIEPWRRGKCSKMHTFARNRTPEAVQIIHAALGGRMVLRCIGY